MHYSGRKPPIYVGNLEYFDIVVAVIDIIVSIITTMVILMKIQLVQKG